MKPLTLQISGSVFTIRLWPTVLTLLMVAVLIALGTWQVERLQWKTDLLATIDRNIHQAPVDVLTIGDPQTANYRPARALGVFDRDQIFYLISISLKGEGGYHVLMPLHLENGQDLLVDRGWIPYVKIEQSAHGQDQFYRPVGSVLVSGILKLPQHRIFKDGDGPTGDPPFWTSINLSAMAKEAKVPNFLPYVLEVDATPNPGGYPVGGQTRVDLPNNHLSYALTWYGLALALLVIYGISMRRKVI